MPTLERADTAWQKELRNEREGSLPKTKKPATKRVLYYFRKLRKDYQIAQSPKKMLEKSPEEFKELSNKIFSGIKSLKEFYEKGGDLSNKYYKELKDMYNYWMVVASKENLPWFSRYNKIEIREHLLILSSIEVEFKK